MPPLVVPRLHTAFAMLHRNSMSLLPVLALALTAGCQERPMARASAEPGEGQTANVEVRTSEGPTYDEANVARTGVRLHPKVAEACGVEQPKAFFAFDSSDVPVDDRSALDLVANCFSTGPLKGQNVVLVGHTDPRGTDAYNKQLGKSRADAVAEYLRGHGVSPKLIDSGSRGEEDSTSDPTGWPLERRVDIMLDDAPAP